MNTPTEVKAERIEIRTQDMAEGLRRWAYMEACDFQDIPDNRATRGATPLRMRASHHRWVRSL